MPTILITGAGRGLGFELARQYAEDGWRVFGTVRDAGAAKKLEKLGAQPLTVDITDFKTVRQLDRQLKGAPLDLLFCNAGISGKRGMALGSFDFAEWENVLRVNLLGAAAVVEALADHVAASERKTIALMSSQLGSISESSGMTLPYSTSKAALNMLAKGLSANLSHRGVIVVALSPGWVKTDMGGAGAPLTVDASVRGLRKILSRVRLQDSGTFLCYDGSAIAW
jgi:NAD(P)-dependent dehydrogenase (short-subunit alcohol dehydrogenase family)